MCYKLKTPDNQKGEANWTPLTRLLRQTCLSQGDIARAANFSKGTVSMLFSKHQWPKSENSKFRLYREVKDLLIKNGCDPNEVEAALNFGVPDMKKLTRHALDVFNLMTDPFGPANVRTTEDVFKTIEHAAALKQIRLAAEQGQFLVLFAEQGTGKTTAVNESEIYFQEQGSYIVVRIGQSDTKRLKVDSVVNELASRYGIGFNIDRSLKVNRLREALFKNDNQKVVCIVDNGHSLPISTLIEIKQLWDHMTLGHRKMLAMVLVCQDQIINYMQAPQLAEVHEHVTWHEMLGLYGPGEIQKYLEIRLRNYRRKDAKPGDPDNGWTGMFTPEVPELFYDIAVRMTNSQYIRPRYVNSILASAIQVASEVPQDIVDANVIRNVFRYSNGHR